VWAERASVFAPTLLTAMRFHRAVVLRTLAVLLGLAAVPMLPAAVDLATVLRNMDATAAKFQGIQAHVEWVKYTAIVDIKSVEEGTIFARRNKDHSMDVLIEFDSRSTGSSPKEPYNYFVSVRGTKLQIYRPRIATVEEYDVSKSKDVLDQVLLLGFGAAGSFLEKNYTVTLRGEETAAGQETVKLELVPKSEELLKRIPRLEMWVSKSMWHPVQEKFYEVNSGDYRLHTYTDIVLNPPLKDSQIRLNLPGNVKKVSPQK
jgi:outer membrane lipoprotein-sorting protein